MSDLVIQTIKIARPNSKLKRDMAVSAYVHKTADQPSHLVLAVVSVAGVKDAAQIIDTVLETLIDTYAGTKLTDVFERFEAAIHALNSKAKPFPVRSIKVILAVVAADQIHLTNGGGGSALLIRNGVEINMISGLKATRGKFLGTVVSGPLKKSDSFFLATPSLTKTGLSAELDNAIQIDPIEAAAGPIERLLKDNGAYAAIVAKVTDRQQLGDTILPPLVPESSQSDQAAKAVKTTMPRLQQIGLTLLNRIKKMLSFLAKSLSRIRAPRVKPRSLMIFALLLVIVSSAAWFGPKFSKGNEITKLEKKYKNAYQLFHSSETNDDPSQSRKQLQQSKIILADLSNDARLVQLNNVLTKHRHSADDPANVQKLLGLTSDSLGRLGSAAEIKPNLLIDFSKEKKTPPSLLELADKRLLMVENKAIMIFDTNTGKITSSVSLPKAINKIVDTGLSDDSLYLLSDEPAVWQYQFDDKSVDKINLSSGKMPSGNAIESYNGNLYILSSAGVLKLVPTLAGFSPPQTSINFDQHQELKSAHALAVDGSILVAGNGYLARFIAGKLEQKSSLIKTLRNPRTIVSSGDIIMTLDQKTSQIAVYNTGDKDLPLKKQYSLAGTKKLSSLAYDISTNTAYALADNRLIKFKP